MARSSSRAEQRRRQLSAIMGVGTSEKLTSLEDDRALLELSAEIDRDELESFLILRHLEDAKKQEAVPDQEESKPDRPFLGVSVERLNVLSDYWHPTVAAGALEELARLELIHFTKYTWPGYQANWHHIVYARKLDAFARGETKKLMVFMGPQHGKSELCSRRLPAKMLGDNPDLHLGLISYNKTWASGFNLSAQRIIDNERYRRLYPDTTLSGVGNRSGSTVLRNMDEFGIVGHEGDLVSAGIDGGLTGRPLDVAIIDDPYRSQKDAWSPAGRKSVQNWYETVLLTRLHNESQQLLTLTRWHEKDLAGYLLETEGDEWDIVKFPALKEGPPTEIDPRQPGEALWPQRHSKERLEAVKKRNIYVFNGMYQQDPKPAEGLLFPPDSLHYFTHDEIADVEFDSIVAVSDVADTGSDFYCMLIAGLLGERIYILDAVFTQEPVKVTVPLTLGMLRDWRPAKHRIESNSAGSVFAYIIKEQKTTPTTIEPKFTSANKETRILMASGQVQEYCWFREDAAAGTQYAEYLDALTGYMLAGGNEHDDAPDATTMLIEMVHPQKPKTEVRLLGGDGKDGAPVSTLKTAVKGLLNRLSDNRPDKWF